VPLVIQDSPVREVLPDLCASVGLFQIILHAFRILILLNMLIYSGHAHISLLLFVVPSKRYRTLSYVYPTFLERVVK